MQIYNTLPLFIILILLIVTILRYIRKNREATTISGILTSMSVYLCVIPLVAVWLGDTYTLDNSFYSLSYGFENYFVCYSAISLFLLTLTVSYNYTIRNSKRLIIVSRLKTYTKYFAYFTLIVGGVSFVIYAYSFGGFAQLLLYAEAMRSFATDKADLFSDKSFILVVPSRLITVTPILLILYRRFSRHSNWNSILIIGSTVLASIFFLSNAGKTGILIFSLCFFVPILSYKCKHKWIVTIFLAICSIEIINYLDALFVYLATGQFEIEASTGTFSYLKQFSYPISNLLNLQGISTLHGFRYGQDYLTGVLNIVPGINFEPAYAVTSEYYGGADWKITGGTPNDAITFGFLQLGFLGVGFEAFLLGRICGIIDKSMLLLDDSFSNRLLKCTLIIVFFSMFVNADIVAIVRGQPTLTILVIIVILSSRNNLKNNPVRYETTSKTD